MEPLVFESSSCNNEPDLCPMLVCNILNFSVAGQVKFSKLSTAVNPAQRPKPLEADERGRLLGEEALPKTSEVQQGGKDASASQKSAQRIGSRPYLDNIAESDRKMLQDVLKGNFVRYATWIQMIYICNINTL